MMIDGFDRCVFSMLLIMLWFGGMLEQNDYILMDIYVYIQCIFEHTLCFYICISFFLYRFWLKLWNYQ